MQTKKTKKPERSNKPRDPRLENAMQLQELKAVKTRLAAKEKELATVVEQLKAANERLAAVAPMTEVKLVTHQ